MIENLKKKIITYIRKDTQSGTVVFSCSATWGASTHTSMSFIGKKNSFRLSNSPKLAAQSSYWCPMGSVLLLSLFSNAIKNSDLSAFLPWLDYKEKILTKEQMALQWKVLRIEEYRSLEEYLQVRDPTGWTWVIDLDKRLLYQLHIWMPLCLPVIMCLYISYIATTSVHLHISSQCRGPDQTGFKVTEKYMRILECNRDKS